MICLQAVMAAEADAFIALPGGFGTLEVRAAFPRPCCLTAGCGNLKPVNGGLCLCRHGASSACKVLMMSKQCQTLA